MNCFDEIIGYEKEKIEIRQICDILKRKEYYLSFGVKMPRGVLLEGEPGLGKTMFANALIKESGLYCIHVKKDKPNEEFIKSITNAFEEAKEKAPCIVFLDDVDKFAERSGRENENQEEFVAIQTGMETIKDYEVLVVATANETGYLPYSLLRAGRFDKRIEFNYPTRDEAEKIIDYYLKDKKVEDNVKGKYIARMLKNTSCATLATVLNEAGIYAAYNNSEKISFENITDAIARLVGGINLYEMPQNKEMLRKTAYHEAGHVVMAMLSKSIVPTLATVCRCDERRGVTFTDDNENVDDDVMAITEKILCGIAGQAAISLVYKTCDVGVARDNGIIYEMLRTQVTKDCIFGYEYISFSHSYDSCFSMEQENNIAKIISEKMSLYFDEAKKILYQNRELLDRVAFELQEKKILSIFDFEKIQKEFNI